MGVTTQKYGISVTLWPKLAIYGKIRCFQATWVTFEVQSDSDDVKLDLSLATWVPEPTEGSSDLWATRSIIECAY
jgi:hypothetical protein